MSRTTGILVIKLGALGDFIQALGPFAAIRRHHRDAHITLLTTAPFVRFAERSGYFDSVWVTARLGPFQWGARLDLRRKLKSGRFDRVYDLQTSNRSSFLYHLYWPGPYPEWSGIARGCSHPHANPGRDFMHTLERQTEQLNLAGIEHVPAPDLSWAESRTGRFSLAGRYALMIPGGAPHRLEKRWPMERFASLAQEMVDVDVMPVLLGTQSDGDTLARINAICPQASNLSGQTGLEDIAVLARNAVCAVGNDTGPMHLTAVAGCLSVVLYSHASDPTLCGQRGAEVAILRREPLDNLAVEEVARVCALTGG